ncbi:MAG TPA: uroporphyrinogen decarboxylase [Rhizomicrobium sp.]|nr:uroporphyrinogen decarboxylase [Rhizomicrobium sp.]
MTAKLLSVLEGDISQVPPIWLMRQAGRYLPEYRALRAKAGSFWSMCMSPEMAAEITLQPIRRFGFDAAIIFSDILVVPFALGSDVKFEDGVGPSLKPITGTDGLLLDPTEWATKLAPVYEVLRAVRATLTPETALLGFAGAPWTLATYMAAGRGGDEQRAAKLWGYRDPAGFEKLLDTLGDCVAAHLVAQLDAGADAVQIFDSWASGLPDERFARWVIAPTKRVVDTVRKQRPNAKIIGFPRASTLRGYELFAAETGVDCVSVDTSAPMDWAASSFSDSVAVQGNLDPVALLAGGDALRDAVDRIVDTMRGKRFIFNLGHGVLPETPPEHVTELVARVRQA